MDIKLTRLQEMLDSSENIVFFGGAGVSTESKIPDFRSDNGVYQQSPGDHAFPRILRRTYL